MDNQDVHPSLCRTLDPSNPFYPLPKDYGDLTAEGQRQARIATVSRQNTPMEVVQAWDLFRNLYLRPTQPGFFYHNYCPSPDFHYEAIYDAGQYNRNLLAAPRGTAKSWIIGLELPLFLLLTVPYIRIVLSLATDRQIEERFDLLMKQFNENEFIIADFGRMKPPRGTKIWNRHQLSLLNGSVLNGYSIMGKKRGARPDLFILDDPEFDPEGENSAITLREKFEVYLFKQVIPMLEKESSIFWVGTMIGRRSFLYHACHGDDPRFQFWNRKVLMAEKTDPHDSTKTTVLWDGKWSKEALDIRRAEIGEGAYSSEYLNTPISEGDRVLKLGEEKCGYTITDFDGEDPYTSKAIVTCHKYDKETRKWTKKEEPLSELVKKLFIILTYDPAKSISRYSDYNSLAVLGFDANNCMWVLDLWVGRAKEVQVMMELYKLGLKWRPKVVGIESISKQKEIVEAADTFLKEHGEASGWTPKVIPVDYHNVRGPKGKADRISSLEWRFDRGKIKYPFHLEDKWPFSILFLQTRDFTYDLIMLQHDDAIDSVAMGHYVIHNKGIKTRQERTESTVAEKIAKGEVNVGGIPILSGYNACDLTPEILNALDKCADRQYNSKLHRRKKKVYDVRRRRYDRKPRFR